jgi:hypothetical protein
LRSNLGALQIAFCVVLSPRVLTYSRGVEGLDALEIYLRVAPILTWGDNQNIDGGHPEKHRVVLAGGVQVLAKPGFDQWEPIPRREAAGWMVAKHLGFLGLVAATVLRDVPRLSTREPVMSSLQVLWPDGRQWLTPIAALPDDEVWQAAVFDAIVARADHANNNSFGVPGPGTGSTPHLRLVDTGNAFDISPASPPNSSFYQHRLDDDLPEDVLRAVREFVEAPTSELEDLLGRDEAERVGELARQLADREVLHIG